MADVSTHSQPAPWLEVLLAEHEALRPVDPAGRARLTSADGGTPAIAALNSTVFRAGHSALCLSGGGVRSASFSVGVLQALARLGVLRRLDYLSTVSGGGFAGAWLTAWLHRARTDPAAAGELEQLETGNRAADDVEPEPLLRLRRYIRYMSPREGFFSADAWTLGATMVRNLLLNWLVLLPLMAAALLVPRLHYALIHVSDRDLTPGLTFGWTDLETWMLLCAAAMYAVSLAFVVRDLPSYGNARRSQRIFVARCLLPLCLGTLALTYFWAVDRVPLSLGWILAVCGAGHALLWIAVGFLSGSRAVRPRAWFAAALSAAVPAAGLYWLTQVAVSQRRRAARGLCGHGFSPCALVHPARHARVHRHRGSGLRRRGSGMVEPVQRVGAHRRDGVVRRECRGLRRAGGLPLDAGRGGAVVEPARDARLRRDGAPGARARRARRVADTAFRDSRKFPGGPPDCARALGPGLRRRAARDAVVGRRAAGARAVAIAGARRDQVRHERLRPRGGRARGRARVSSGRRRLRGGRRPRARPPRLRRRHGTDDPGQQVLARRDVPLPARPLVSRGVARRAIAQSVHRFRSGRRLPNRGAAPASAPAVRCT